MSVSIIHSRRTYREMTNAMTPEEEILSKKYLLFLRLAQGLLAAPILMTVLWYIFDFINKRYLYEIPWEQPGWVSFCQSAAYA